MDKRVRLSSCVEQPRPNGSLQGADLVKGFPALLGQTFRLDHDIADLAIRLQMLARDVEAALREGVVEAAEDAGHVPMHMNVARAGGPGRELNLRKVDGSDRRADVGVLDKLLGTLGADALLRFFRRSADMRC